MTPAYWRLKYNLFKPNYAIGIAVRSEKLNKIGTFSIKGEYYFGAKEKVMKPPVWKRFRLEIIFLLSNCKELG